MLQEFSSNCPFIHQKETRSIVAVYSDFHHLLCNDFGVANILWHAFIIAIVQGISSLKIISWMFLQNMKNRAIGGECKRVNLAHYDD